MPLASLSGLTIYYETYGDGMDRSLVMINGLGSDHREWLYQVPAFRQHFRVVLFDNRGCGMSDAPPGPYTTDQMAGDVRDLLAYLGIERASLLGVSMGGLIAQKVAILYPDVVDRLVLACTGVGGEHSVKPSPEAMEVFRSYNESDPEGSLRDMLPYLYTPGFIERNDPEVDRFIRYALDRKQNMEGYMAQLAAISTHASYHDLSRIRAETLVITGDADRLILPENSEILAENIPGASLKFLAGAPHRLFAERWEEFNEKVLAFLTG